MIGFAGKVSLCILSAGLLFSAAPVQAGDLSLASSGSLSGYILNPGGFPQIGASIQLFDHVGKLVAHAASNTGGEFSFTGLPADSYSVRASFADYLPAHRDSVPVRDGLQSILRIHLTSVLSSVEVTYSIPTTGMSPDWKWVLRSSPATRLITRFDGKKASISQPPDGGGRVFSGTHAVLSLGAGDNNVVDPDTLANDLGTGFAVETKIFAKNSVEFGGSVSPTTGLTPAAFGLCAIYRRQDGGPAANQPEITFSMSQLGVGPGAGTASPGDLGGTLPVVRTMSLSMYQALELGDLARVEFGASADSIDYVGNSTRLSPFARVTVGLGSLGDLIASYNDGSRPDELRAHWQDAVGAGAELANAAELQTQATDELGSAVNSLSRLPQLSYRDNRLQMQRTLSYEVGYRKVVRPGTLVSTSAFSESVTNGRVNVSGDTSMLPVGDVMSDGVSATSVYNIGNFARTGVVSSVEQRVNSFFEGSVAYGRIGGLYTGHEPGGGQAGAVSAFLDQHSHNVANAGLTAKLPRARTRLTANYGWMDGNAVVPRHVFTTQNTYLSPGLNIFVRQPLPSFFGMPGHLELNADLRNLMAEGYVPLDPASGRTLLLVQSPRAIRGGLNFTF